TANIHSSLFLEVGVQEWLWLVALAGVCPRAAVTLLLWVSLGGRRRGATCRVSSDKGRSPAARVSVTWHLSCFTRQLESSGPGQTRLQGRQQAAPLEGRGHMAESLQHQEGEAQRQHVCEDTGHTPWRTSVFTGGIRPWSRVPRSSHQPPHVATYIPV
ncbi:hypothetical protein H1C71_032977, partial [Ictidomys tridecemlineatus]